MAPCGLSKSHKLLFMKEMLVGAVGIEITLSSVLKGLRNILRNRKKQLSSVGNAYCCPKAAAFFSSRLPHRQQHFYDFTVCFPHRLWDRLRVDVHGCPNVRVTQQFLLHLHVHTKRSEKSRVRNVCQPMRPILAAFPAGTK
jgi:hypothetical protein